MKQVIIALSCLALTAGFTSCKKDYQCDCTINGQAVSSQKFNATKKDAKASCDAIESSTSMNGITASCEVK